MTGSFILVGDSNSSVIARAANSKKLAFRGGPLSAGRFLDDLFFTVENNVFTLNPSLNSRFEGGLDDLLVFDGPILSTVGFNTQRFSLSIYRFCNSQKISHTSISDAVLWQCMFDSKVGAIAFYKLLLEHGREIYFAHSPQRFPASYFDLALRIEAMFIPYLQELGASLVDVRDQTTTDRRLRPEFDTERENDMTHANEAWGSIVLDQFLRVSGLSAD